MEFQSLRKALEIRNHQVRISTDTLDEHFTATILNTFYDKGRAIVITEASPGPADGDNTIVIQGKALFPQLADEQIATPLAVNVTATFALDEKGALSATLRYGPINERSFAHIFPNLPARDNAEESVLDGLRLTDCYFVLTTHQHRDTRFNIELQRGLNFVSTWTPAGMLGLFQHMFHRDTLTLYGPIVLPEHDHAPSLTEGQLPWDVETLVPGIHLQAKLGFTASFPPPDGKMQFSETLFRLYSPITFDWFLKNLDYEPVMAYVGSIAIPSIRAEPLGTLAAVSSLGLDDFDNEVVIRGKFSGVNLDNLSQLIAMAGTNDSGSDDLAAILMPEPIRNTLGKIELQEAAVHLTSAGGRFEVAYTAFTIGIGVLWPVVEKTLEIGLKSVQVVIAKPFDSKQRSISASIKGSMRFLNVPLDVTVKIPGFFIYAEQTHPVTIQLQDVFNQEPFTTIPVRPPNFTIDHITVTAEPDSYYAFSMSMAADRPWTIDGEYTLPALHLAISTTGWQFEARTDYGAKGIPIVKLLAQLAAEVGGFPKDIALPSSIEGITIDHFVVSYNTQSKDLYVLCEGKLPLIADKPPIEAQVTIDIEHLDGTSRKTFGGQLIIYPEEGQPLYFTLIFDKEPTAQTFLATYHEPEGREIGVDALLSEVLKETIATGLHFTLKDALYAYSKREEITNLLFGLGVGLDIDLSKLPLVGPLMVQMLGGRTVGIQDLRLLVARLAFSRQDVDALNRLMPAGIPALPLPASAQAEQSVALDRGLHVSATLNLGGAPQPLALPTSAASAPPERDGGVPHEAGPGDKAIKPSDSAKWFNIDQTLGPFHLQRLGVAWKDQRLWFLLDASLDLMGLTLGLAGLGVSLPLADPKPERLQFDLQGLEIGFKQGPVEISGGLLRAGNAYTGMALLKTEAFTITGIGSYTQIEGVDSLFIYAVLDRDLGGPAFFHVTGLAAGFGYNRALTLPPIDQVQAFPLVEVAMHPKALRDLSAVSGKIDRFLTPAQGQYWLAVGVRFSSFELIESFAMLTVAFGTETTIAILGLSKITIPKLPGVGAEPPPTPVPPIAYAELAIKVQLQPERGVLMAEARLTPNSYLFTKECHLTGGFAFYVWFGKHEHAGDFVVTLGGYHPKFVVPAHYPVVPRVGLNWQVSPNLAVQGELYFALTPTCLMAGGRLGALYRQGGLQAWFEAYIDALIVWEPLHYEMQAGIRLGASYYADFLGVTLSLEMAAKAHFWGPPFAGKVDITWAILSFTIYFGDSQSPAEPESLKWKPFQDAFLPRATSESSEPDPLTIAITRGLIHEVKEGDGYVIVNPHQLRLRVVSAVPSRTITMNGHTFSDACTLGIRPMGIRQLDSRLTIALKHSGDEARNFIPAAIYQNVPGALWSAAPFDRNKERQETELIHDALIGVQCEPVAPQLGQDAVTLDDPQALYTPIQAERCAWEYAYAVTAADYDPREVRTHIQTPSPTVRNTRQTILNNLADSQLFAPPPEVMTQAMDAASTMVLCATPVECGLGMLPNTRG
jgi:hypothetical protein